MNSPISAFRYPTPSHTTRFSEAQKGNMEKPKEWDDFRSIERFENHVNLVKEDILAFDNTKADGNDSENHVVVAGAKPSNHERSNLEYRGTYEQTEDGFKLDVRQDKWYKSSRKYEGASNFRILDTPEKTIYQKNELPSHPLDADEVQNRTLEYDKVKKEWSLMSFDQPFSIFEEPKAESEVKAEPEVKPEEKPKTLMERLSSLWS